MADYPHFKYSMKQVMRAGEALRGDLIWTPETRQSILDVFEIGNNFRDAHAYPMKILRQALAGQMRRLGQQGHTGARLKRMPSIRRKLRDQPHKLNQIQDLAGCRAILPSIGDVLRLCDAMRDKSGHVLHHQDPYIERPKTDGYRCNHLVFKFQGVGADQYFNGRRVEIQIRTRLQHSWATAVEAVGLFRKENLKGGSGSPQWLRLFKLVSAEFALIEGCYEGADQPPRPERLSEIRALERELGVLSYLENSSQVVRFTEKYAVKPGDIPVYYRIIYDRKNRVVNVEPHFGVQNGIWDYDNAEIDIDKNKNDIATVLVEADGIEELKAAFPNYFGDMQLFRMQLGHIVQGRLPPEYTMPPQTVIPPKIEKAAPLSWFKRRIRWE
jgi:hypothetical protein